MRIWLLLLLTGCTGPTSTPAPKPSTAKAPEANESGHTLRYIERLTGGARPDEALPMVVAVHGLGDRPENFVGLFDDWQYKARVVLPAGPTPWGKGHAWMTVRSAETERSHALAKQTLDAADRVAALIKDLSATRPTSGTPVVTGFSQGGMISYTLAAHHSEAIGAAVPVSGFLPPPLYPKPGTQVAPVRALHGDADRILSVDFAKETVQRFKGSGGDATLRIYPSLGHTISRPMRAELFCLLEEATGSVGCSTETRAPAKETPLED